MDTVLEEDLAIQYAIHENKQTHHSNPIAANHFQKAFWITVTLNSFLDKRLLPILGIVYPVW
jgi:hypothetical protein